VLGIIAEFHHVEVSIVTLQQVRLRPSAHFPDQPYRVDGHRKWKKSILPVSARVWQSRNEPDWSATLIIRADHSR